MNDDNTNNNKDGTKNSDMMLTTIDHGRDFVDKSTFSYQNLRTKDVGIQLMLFGMTELSVKRAIDLQTFISKVEQKLFSDQMMENMVSSPRDLLSAYELVIKTNRDNLDFISRTRKELDWDNINETLNSHNQSLIKDNTDESGNFVSQEQSEIDRRKMANKIIESILATKKPVKS